MRVLEAPTELFGLSLTLSRPRVVALVDGLEEAWRAQQGGNYPLDLDADLKTLAAFFDPLAREATLRRRLDQLAQTPIELPGTFLLDAGSGRRVVTPEGRVALDVLRGLLTESGETVRIDAETLAAAHAVVDDFYRSLARRRLDKVRALAAGEAPPMLP